MPGEPASAGRAIATNQSGETYVLNGNGAVSAYNGAPFFGSAPLADADSFRDLAPMPDGGGYVVLANNGLVYKFGSATDPATVGTLSMGYFLGDDIARSIAVMPDGKGYLILLRDGRLLKYGSAATGPIGTLPAPSWPGADHARSLAVMPDGQGYVVLDTLGGVHKYGTALQGAVGAGSDASTGVSTSVATS